MKIERLEIISFGKLKNKVIDFTDGLNIIYGDNESGKSTTINFIYAMLYGFGESRTKALSLREKYTPWDGGVCEGKMIVKTNNGESISIYRKAGSVKKYDVLHIHNTVSGEELSLSPEDIIGVESDTFLKTLCIRQLGSSFDGANDEIAQKLSNLSSGGDEGVSFEKAQKILDSVRREIQPQRGGGGAYSEVTKKITDAQKSLEIKKNAQAELSNLLSLIPREEEKVNSLEKSISSLLKKDYNSSVAHISGRIEEMEKRSGKTQFILPLILLALFFATLFISIKISVIPLVLFLASAVFLKAKNNNIENLKKEKEKLIFEKEENEKKISKLKSEIEISKARLMDMKIREESLKITSEKDEDNIKELYRKKEALEKNLKTISLVSKALSSAYENMQKNFTPALNDKASEYFSVISGGKYNRIFCDKEFGVSVESTIPRESGFFSGGTVDQLYLSLRLALIDMIFGEKECPIILDQPFLQYDDSRKRNTLALFEDIKKYRQVIIFTADKTLSDRNI